MDGLERIKTEILAEADARVEAIMLSAEQYRLEQEQAAQSKGEALLAEAKKRADKEADRLLARMESLADATSKRAALQARQDQIQVCIEQALERLKARPEQERVAHLAALVEGSDCKDGELLLNAADQALMAPLLERVGKAFKAGKEAAQIMGGLLIRREQIIENYSYDLYVRNHRSELSRLVSDLLFDKGQAE